MGELKQCRKCREWKAVEGFHCDKGRRDGLKYWCKECTAAKDRAWYESNKGRANANYSKWQKNNPGWTRRRNLRYKYKLTLDEYDQLLKSQGGVCALCGVDTPGGRGQFHVDHDHNCCPGEVTCGKCINGLLCTSCNVGLGKYVKFSNDPRTQEYLNNPPARAVLNREDVA